jgi:two-component system, cell cycle sensor histidine kinase and response regulator CckA
MDLDYRGLVENFRDVIYTADAEGKVTYVNSAVESILGYSPAEMTGQSLFEFLHGEDAGAFKGHFHQCASGDVGEAEYRIVSKTGEELWVRSSCWPVRGGSGKHGLQGVWMDVTRRKKEEAARTEFLERLRRAEKIEALGIVAGAVAHDLNNALGILVGYAELLLHDLPAGSHLREHASNIVEGGERAAAIVQDLVSMARKGGPAGQTVNLNAIVGQYVKSPEFAALTGTRNRIRVQTVLDIDLLNVNGSFAVLGKILANLVIHGVEDMPEGGLLSIRTENRYLDQPVRGYEEIPEGEYAVLTVADTGTGISPGEIRKYIEYAPAGKVCRPSLALVRETVAEQSGHIDIKSEVGKGTTVAIYLPAWREEAASERNLLTASAYRGRAESVLVVDDVKGQRELAAGMLMGLNYLVTTAASGEEALRYMQRNRVDIVLLDMIMPPGMNGLDTYKEITKIRPRQRAVLASGFSQQDRIRQAQALGAGACVRKPYVMETLARAIRCELDRLL